MENKNEMVGNVTGKMKAIIRANHESTDLNTTFYAINWFSTKIEWMYHFYNFLATRSVLKVGAKPFFKGKVSKTFLDENDTGRELILIVKYPGGQNFIKLMEDTYFKLVSIFRILSVKNFTFGFTKKESLDNNSFLEDRLSYAIHHFKMVDIDQSFFEKFNQLVNHNIQIKYAGFMVAQLYSQKVPAPAEAIPNLMDGLVIFEAQSEELIQEMFNSEVYQNLIKELDSSYIGFLDRIL